jgi:hypothetical protein
MTLTKTDRANIADYVEAQDARIARLEALLRRARGWVITWADTATAREDLRLIDEALKGEVE